MRSIVILTMVALLGCSGRSGRESSSPSASGRKGPPDLGEVSALSVGENILLTYDVGEDVEDQSFTALNARMALEADAACPSGYEIVNQTAQHGAVWGYESMSWTIRCNELGEAGDEGAPSSGDQQAGPPAASSKEHGSACDAGDSSACLTIPRSWGRCHFTPATTRALAADRA